MEANNQNIFEGVKGLKALDFGKIRQTSQEKHLSTMKDLGIKVQSVVFPPNFNEVRDEKKVISWLYKNIQSLHTANYELRLKYASE